MNGYAEMGLGICFAGIGLAAMSLGFYIIASAYHDFFKGSGK